MVRVLWKEKNPCLADSPAALHRVRNTYLGRDVSSSGQSAITHQNVSVAIWDSVCLGGKRGFFAPRLWDIGISALQLAK